MVGADNRDLDFLKQILEDSALLNVVDVSRVCLFSVSSLDDAVGHLPYINKIQASIHTKFAFFIAITTLTLMINQYYIQW